ncbi:MAG TPA: hypothetical protein VNA16_01515 [Abditibacteriaceae bacterium]|nr:hypothetical protein [Abditibacteriaceae bacterium]
MHTRKLGPDGPPVGAIGLGSGPVAAHAERPSQDAVTRLMARAAAAQVSLTPEQVARLDASFV